MIHLDKFESGIEILRAFEIKNEWFEVTDLGIIVEIKLPIQDYSEKDCILRDLGWEKCDDKTWQLTA